MFRADDMDNAVPVISHRVMGKPHFFRRLGQDFDSGPHLAFRNIVDGFGRGRHAVVRDAKGLVRLAQSQTVLLERRKRAKMEVVRHMTVDIE